MPPPAKGVGAGKVCPAMHPCRLQLPRHFMRLSTDSDSNAQGKGEGVDGEALLADVLGLGGGGKVRG